MPDLSSALGWHCHEVDQVIPLVSGDKSEQIPPNTVRHFPTDVCCQLSEASPSVTFNSIPIITVLTVKATMEKKYSKNPIDRM